jgi:dihydroorotase
LKNIPEKIITLAKKEFIISEKYWDVVPFKSWKKIEWSIV